MKVALVHDYLNQMGGAERVVMAFHEIFPDAPIYTSIYDPQRVDPAFQQIGCYSQTIDLLLGSLARGGTDHRITPSLRGIELVEDTGPLAPAD